MLVGAIVKGAARTTEAKEQKRGLCSVLDAEEGSARMTVTDAALQFVTCQSSCVRDVW